MIPELAVHFSLCENWSYIPLFLQDFQLCSSSRIIDSECKMVITSDGGYRGNKTIALKEIIDEALEKCTSIENWLLKEQTLITMKEGEIYGCNPY
jgi:acetyl-CoA synthetase